MNDWVGPALIWLGAFALGWGLYFHAKRKAAARDAKIAAMRRRLDAEVRRRLEALRDSSKS